MLLASYLFYFETQFKTEQKPKIDCVKQTNFSVLETLPKTVCILVLQFHRVLDELEKLQREFSDF